MVFQSQIKSTDSDSRNVQMHDFYAVLTYFLAFSRYKVSDNTAIYKVLRVFKQTLFMVSPLLYIV